MRARHITILLVAAVLVVAAGYWVNANYFFIGIENSLEPGKQVFLREQPDTQTSSEPVAYVVEPVVTSLSVPWSIVFTAQNRMLVAERSGAVREVVDGVLLEKPLRVFSEVSDSAEEGLMGMVLDPNYAENSFVYVCLAYASGTDTLVKVVRITDSDTPLTQESELIAEIPAAPFHAGCRLGIGPDTKLYISTGDGIDKNRAQDLSSLAGKLLRLNLDGSIPQDNPFPDSPVYSYGHRNSQGFDWHPESGTLIATEHGPSGFDGAGGGDEVNHIISGKNYGWPVVSHEKTNPEMESPLLVFTPAIAPASGTFYAGSVFPQFTNTFLFGLLRGEGIMQVTFDSEDSTKVSSYQKLEGISVGRVRDVVEGPDGFIYFTTSNTDGRGTPREGDDAVYRLVPQKE